MAKPDVCCSYYNMNICVCVYLKLFILMNPFTQGKSSQGNKPNGCLKKSESILTKWTRLNRRSVGFWAFQPGQAP